MQVLAPQAAVGPHAGKPPPPPRGSPFLFLHNKEGRAVRGGFPTPAVYWNVLGWGWDGAELLFYFILFYFILKILFVYSTEIETASERGNTSRGGGREGVAG